MKVFWSDDARLDLAEIHGYIAEDNLTAAGEVVGTIYAYANQQLREHPSSGRDGKVSGTLELVIPRYRNYIVVYRIDEKDIDVVAVMHGRRRWPTAFGSAR